MSNAQAVPQQTMLSIVDLTQEQARTWLLVNDAEGADLWNESTGDFVGAVQDNLRDFGEDKQDGEFFVTLNDIEIKIISMHWVDDGEGC
jgi:hypothetical protein